MTVKVNLVMAEFGQNRQNSNKHAFKNFNVGRSKFNPTLDSFIKYFSNMVGGVMIIIKSKLY